MKNEGRKIVLWLIATVAFQSCALFNPRTEAETKENQTFNSNKPKKSVEKKSEKSKTNEALHLMSSSSVSSFVIPLNPSTSNSDASPELPLWNEKDKSSKSSSSDELASSSSDEFNLPELIKPQSDVKIVATPENLRNEVEVCLKEGVTDLTISLSSGDVVVAGDYKFSFDGNLKVKLEHGKISVKKNSRLKKKHSYSQDIIIRADSGFIDVGHHKYRGKIKLSINRDNQINAINVIPMEEYLKGVVPHEIGKLGDWGLEAIKAQAVAARTYAYKHLNSRRSRGFDVYADTRDQMYLGVKGEYDLANQAIEETSDIVMEYQGELINAYYHSTCGGQTATLKVWSQQDLPYLQSVTDFNDENKPWCHRSGYTSWTWKWTNSELNKIAQEFLKTARPDRDLEFDKILDLKILGLTTGGRISKIKVYTDAGEVLVRSDRSRWLFRSAKNSKKILPSAWYIVSKDRSGFEIRGRGMGHGIGMCQMGARGRSREGQGFVEILKSYYSGVDLVRYR